jgi:hypothetical protein
MFKAGDKIEWLGLKGEIYLLVPQIDKMLVTFPETSYYFSLHSRIRLDSIICYSF